MRGRALFVSVSIVLALSAGSSSAQLLVRTPLPTVTAENEPWYLNGEPITYAGSVYLPSGAQIYFNSNEMVRSGFYMGVPLYTRTTLEPYSMVFVPLAGGRMQPYERPRTGELTGTTGSTAPTLPPPPQTVPPGGLAPQAAGPPSQTTQLLEIQLPRPEVTAPTVRLPLTPSVGASSGSAVGTAGRTSAPTHTRIGGPPQGTNSIYVEYEGRRWYPIGWPQPFDTSRLVRFGELRGFPVWGNAPEPTALFIPVTRGSTLALMYTRERPEPRD